MPKTTFHIDIYMSELIYDILNKTHIAGQVHDTGDNYKNVALMQAVDEGQSGDHIARSIGNAFGNLENYYIEFSSICKSIIYR